METSELRWCKKVDRNQSVAFVTTILNNSDHLGEWTWGCYQHPLHCIRFLVNNGCRGRNSYLFHVEAAVTAGLWTSGTDSSSPKPQMMQVHLHQVLPYNLQVFVYSILMVNYLLIANRSLIAHILNIIPDTKIGIACSYYLVDFACSNILSCLTKLEILEEKWCS